MRMARVSGHDEYYLMRLNGAISLNLCGHQQGSEVFGQAVD